MRGTYDMLSRDPGSLANLDQGTERTDLFSYEPY